MCSEFQDEISVMRGFLACRDPEDLAEPHTISCLTQDTEKAAEELQKNTRKEKVIATGRYVLPSQYHYGDCASQPNNYRQGRDDSWRYEEDRHHALDSRHYNGTQKHYNASTRMRDDEREYVGDGAVRASNSTSVELQKVFENDKYVTFRKVTIKTPFSIGQSNSLLEEDGYKGMGPVLTDTRSTSRSRAVIAPETHRGRDPSPHRATPKPRQVIVLTNR